MIGLFIFCVFIYVIFALLAWYKARRRNALYWSDLCTPIAIPILWICIVSFGYGHQSLSHIIEVPIALLISLLLLYMRVFILDKCNENNKMNSLLIFGLGLVVVLLLRTFMPYLPE